MVFVLLELSVCMVWNRFVVVFERLFVWFKLNFVNVFVVFGNVLGLKDNSVLFGVM